MRFLVLVPALLVMLAAAARPARDPIFANTTVVMPDDDTVLPPGPHVDAVTQNCTACHSPAMILTQPRLTRAAWEGEVAKMIKVYKAPIDEKDVPVIVDYLVATNARLAR